MKKNINNFKSLLICFLVMGFISTFISSCQDDENLSNSTPHKTMFQGYSDSQIEDELNSFLDHLESIRKDPKDALADEVWELEPILWYMEACVNYKYGASVQPELVKIDTSYVNLPVTDVKCKLGDVQVSYDNIVDSIAANFYQIDAEEKYFLMTNISVANQNSQNVTLQVISYFTLNGIIPNVNDYDWYWGMDRGQCGTLNERPLDAADIIMRGANSSINIPAPEFYYTDSQIGYSGIPYYETDSEGNHLGFLGSQYAGTNVHPCISEQEITFFTQGLILIGENHQIPNKEVVLYELHHDIITADNPYPILHYGNITFGNRHYRNSSTSELPNNQNNI
ncbi:MAG: hypothetical protein RBS29_05285 [Bacteroidales bacterium]|jgi:hypothetical protein|nr:hypothetical protein [Bacteroidales bacterium]